MGHIEDKWTTKNPIKGATPKRVKNARWGNGKRWLARWEAPGEPPRSRAFATKDQAHAFLSTVEADILRGVYLAPSTRTLSEWWEEWYPARQTGALDSVTLANYERHWRLHIQPILGDTPLQAITKLHGEQVIAAVVKKGRKPGTIKAVHRVLSMLLNAAVENDLVRRNTVRSVEVPSVEPKDPRPLTIQEVHAIAEHMHGPLQGAVWVIAGGGMRPGEARSLTKELTHWSEGVATVGVYRQLSDTRLGCRTFDATKGRNKRDVRLSVHTSLRLREHMKTYPLGAQGLLFANGRGGDPFTPSQLWRHWEAAREAACIPEWATWHSLRHHHASLLIAAGVSPRAVADRLGHKSPLVTLATYSHLWESDVDRITDAIDAAYAA